MPEQQTPLFDSKLNLDVSVKELWENSEEVEANESIRSINYEGIPFITYAYRASDMFAQTLERATEHVECTDRHLQKRVELGGHVITYALEPASKKPSFRRLGFREFDPIMAYGITTTPADIEGLSSPSTQLTNEKIKKEVIEPGLKYIDWWLSQSQDPYILLFLHLKEVYDYHHPSDMIFLNNVAPTMDNLASNFIGSPVLSAEALRWYQDLLRNMVSDT